MEKKGFSSRAPHRAEKRAKKDSEKINFLPSLKVNVETGVVPCIVTRPY